MIKHYKSITSIGIFLFIHLFLISSCNDSVNIPDSLSHAEKIMDEYPDSAFTLLTHLEDSMKSKPKSTQMYYRLLTTKAQDKCHIPYTSDSSMLKVTSFYERHNDYNKLMIAYFYLGCIYLDLNDGFQASDYLKKATNISTKSTDYKTVGFIYNRIGDLFLDQQVYSMVMYAYKNAYYYYKLSNDSIMYPYVLKGIARAFDAQNQIDSAIYYYKKGYELALKIQDKHNKDAISDDLAGIYIRKQEYGSAKDVLLNSSDKPEKERDPGLYYSAWGDLYNQTGHADSAIYYYKKAIQTKNIKIRGNCYRNLSEIEKSKSHYKEATDFIYQHLSCTDSILEQSYVEGINKIETYYKFYQTQKENIRLQRVNLIQKLELAVLGFVIVICCMLYYMQLNRRKKTLLIEQEKRLAHMHELLEKTKERKGPQLQKEDLLKQSNIYLRFHEAANETAKITEENWEELRSMVDATYNDFTHRLFILCPSITVIELHICYLIKISINVTGIAKLINRSKSSVSTARSKLYEKIHQKEGTPSMLDTFITNL